jgi:hypothetical protein
MIKRDLPESRDQFFKAQGIAMGSVAILYDIVVEFAGVGYYRPAIRGECLQQIEVEGIFWSEPLQDGVYLDPPASRFHGRAQSTLPTLGRVCAGERDQPLFSMAGAQVILRRGKGSDGKDDAAIYPVFIHVAQQVLLAAHREPQLILHRDELPHGLGGRAPPQKIVEVEDLEGAHEKTGAFLAPGVGGNAEDGRFEMGMGIYDHCLPFETIQGFGPESVLARLPIYPIHYRRSIRRPAA